eukprot:CAMPEP_0170564390 /NCGR_PEP_ID=MMETSP0211-20121228/72625_1 /TAXON_ID=311385 /ORGANISM="Pseudokeronopsis sp., Strain OXSARD2" /LENGTH=93 /DNA_ID=CAMNT_0010883793 /DNA_START=901 /DNA_END=1182 /DNA_ORIENTATION=+
MASFDLEGVIVSEVRVLDELLVRDPPFLLVGQTTIQEAQPFDAQIESFWDGVGALSDVSTQLLLASAEEGKHPGQKLEVDCSQRPNISLVVVA